MEKLSLYKKIALQALQSFYKMSYEEALQMVDEKSVEQLENEKVGGKASINATIKYLIREGGSSLLKKYTEYGKKTGAGVISDITVEEAEKRVQTAQHNLEEINKGFFSIFQTNKVLELINKLGSAREILKIAIELREEEIEKLSQKFEEQIFEEKDFDSSDSESFRRELCEKGIDNNEVALGALNATHEQWIKDADRKGKFFDEKRAGTRFQFLDLSLIGFEEASKDLIFAGPILEELGIKYTEEGIKEAYNRKVQIYLESKGIRTKVDLIRVIQNPEVLGKALSENEKKRIKMQRNSEIATQMAEQVIEKNPEIARIFKENEQSKGEKSELKKVSFWDKIRSLFLKDTSAGKTEYQDKRKTRDIFLNGLHTTSHTSEEENKSAGNMEHGEEELYK